MSINTTRYAFIDKDEWDAIKAFENVTSEQQKIYAKTFSKRALKIYHKKKKNFHLVAAHITYDIMPKILLQYDFNLQLDENSFSSFPQDRNELLLAQASVNDDESNNINGHQEEEIFTQKLLSQRQKRLLHQDGS